MTSLNQFTAEELSLLTAKGQLRQLPDVHIQGVDSESPTIRHADVELLNFSSNDYFGLSTEPAVLKAAEEGLHACGAGAKGSRLVCGQYAAYDVLEQKLATQKNTESALVFTTGYAANTGAIPALMGKADLILADKLSHACLLDGAQLSGATLMRFAHNNIKHLEQLLELHRAEYTNCLIVTESIFSMDGDVAPISDIAALATTFGAWMMVDDAHGLGLTQHILSPIAGLDGIIITGTLSKAAGNLGGYVAGSKALTDYILNTARSFIFSTALPPATVCGAIAALDIIAADVERIQRPLRLAKFFTSILALPEALSPIVPVIIGDNEKAMLASADLLAKGFYVRAIRPPTVPPNTARLRITFNSLHKDSEVKALAEAVKPWLSDVGV